MRLRFVHSRKIELQRRSFEFHIFLPVFNVEIFSQLSLYTFRTNLLTAFAPIVNGFLPLSVIPKSTLHCILQEVVLNENEQGSRLNITIPMTSFMTYYETKLLRQVVSSDFGLIFTMAILFSSQATVLKVYHAVQVPMPDHYHSQSVSLGHRN